MLAIADRSPLFVLIDLEDAFDRLKRTDFWISHKLLDERLALFERQRGGNAG